jgi:hypothetical protein
MDENAHPKCSKHDDAQKLSPAQKAFFALLIGFCLLLVSGWVYLLGWGLWALLNWGFAPV